MAEYRRLVEVELASVALQPIQRLLTDPASAAFSSNFDDRFSGLRLRASAVGCDPRSLTVSALSSVDRVPARGPVAVALKADIVGDLADRARPLAGQQGTLDVAILATVTLPAGLRRCSDVSRNWLAVYQIALDAMDSVPLNRYLSGGDLRESDIRDNPDGGGGLHFADASLDQAISSLLDAGPAIGCSDDAVARQLLARGEELRAHSATATVYKADQLAIAQLFLAGI